MTTIRQLFDRFGAPRPFRECDLHEWCDKGCNTVGERPGFYMDECLEDFCDSTTSLHRVTQYTPIPPQSLTYYTDDEGYFTQHQPSSCEASPTPKRSPLLTKDPRAYLHSLAEENQTHYDQTSEHLLFRCIFAADDYSSATCCPAFVQFQMHGAAFAIINHNFEHNHTLQCSKVLASSRQFTSAFLPELQTSITLPAEGLHFQASLSLILDTMAQYASHRRSNIKVGATLDGALLFTSTISSSWRLELSRLGEDRWEVAKACEPPALVKSRKTRPVILLPKVSRMSLPALQ